MTDDLHVTVFADDARVQALSSYTDRLDELAAVFADASAGDGALLDRRPADDAWSVAEVIHHLADAETILTARLHQMLAEDRPVWSPWSADDYAASLLYAVRPAADALTLILALRNLNVRLLASLAPEQWLRTAVHPAKGEVDVAGWVELTNAHLELHVLQARRAVVGMI